MPKLALNVYQNRFGRSELNLHSGAKLNERRHMGTFLHGATIYGRPDHNHDGFLDLTNGQTFSLLQRFAYQGKRMEAQLGLQAYADRKNGGQVAYAQAVPGAYGMLLESQHLSLFSKTGFFGKKPAQSLGLIANIKYQDLSKACPSGGFTRSELFSRISKLIW